MLLAQMNTPAEQVIAHAAALQKAHEGDPRFEMLMAFAYSQEKQDEAAKKWLMQASTRKPPDAQFVADLALQLDEMGLFAESDAFLTRSADVIADAAVGRMLAERLWEDGKISELQERLKNQSPQSPRSDGVLMAYRALALYADVKMREADALVQAVSLRTDAPSAAWAIALQAHFARTPLSASELASRLQTAVGRDPENPVLHEMLAEAYLRMNESELVIQQCSLASQHARSWAAPFLMLAEAQTTTGRQAEAVESARQALERAAQSLRNAADASQDLFRVDNRIGPAIGLCELARVSRGDAADVSRRPKSAVVCGGAGTNRASRAGGESGRGIDESRSSASDGNARGVGRNVRWRKTR